MIQHLSLWYNYTGKRSFDWLNIFFTNIFLEVITFHHAMELQVS